MQKVRKNCCKKCGSFWQTKPTMLLHNLLTGSMASQGMSGSPPKYQAFWPFEKK